MKFHMKLFSLGFLSFLQPQPQPNESLKFSTIYFFQGMGNHAPGKKHSNIKPRFDMRYLTSIVGVRNSIYSTTLNVVPITPGCPPEL